MVNRRHLLATGAGLAAALLPDTAHALTAPDAHAQSRRVLERDLAARRHSFRASDYAGAADGLPHRLKQAQYARAGASGPAHRAASGVLARLHILATELDIKAGRDTSAWSHAQAAVSAAEDTGSAPVLAEAIRICATPLRRQNRADEAVRLLQATMSRLDAASRGAAPETIAASGSLALTAGYSAALAGQRTTALALTEAAQDAADRLRREHRTPGPDLADHQVDLYRIGIFALLGDDVTAVAVARSLDPRALPTDERRARHGTDTIRALLALGDYARAYDELIRIETYAPQEVARPSLRKLTGQVLQRRPNLPGLRDFAARTGAAAF